MEEALIEVPTMRRSQQLFKLLLPRDSLDNDSILLPKLNSSMGMSSFSKFHLPSPPNYIYYPCALRVRFIFSQHGSMTKILSLNDLAKIPFYLGHKNVRISQDMLLRRWEYEIGATSRCLEYCASPNVLILCNDTKTALLEQTLASVRLQTYSVDKIVTYSFISGAISILPVEKDRGVDDCSCSDLASLLGSNISQWTIIIQAGDLCNPSMVYSLIANSQHSDQIIYWDVILAAIDEIELMPISYAKMPLVDLLSEEITPCSCFAVRGNARIKAIRNILESFHPAIALDAIGEKKINDFLSIKNISKDFLSPIPLIESTMRLELLEHGYGTAFEITNIRGLDIPLPQTKPTKISVIVMYKDKPCETRDCITSILSNSEGISLEIVLIDNNSSQDTKEQIDELVSESSDLAEFICLTYSNPFNHSAQILFGLENASNELVALINNDVIIQDSSVLMHSAKWALCSNVASVGVLHKDEYGENRGGPFKRRDYVTNIFNSLVEEYAQIPARPFRSFGNTFAFTVARKSIFHAVSPDPFRFPNGYNDVDYCLRAHRSGYDHITLGYLSLIHLKGATRGKTDESCQKAILRSRFSSFYLEPSPLTENQMINREPIQF